MSYINNINTSHFINLKMKQYQDQYWDIMRKRLGWLPINIIKKTFDVTTQLAKLDVRLPLRRHFKSRFPQANVNRLQETFSTDTFFASTTGIIVFLNKTPIKWYCKKQNTIETSTYGAELVAARLAAEQAIEFRYKLRMLGVPIDGPTIMLGDNKSVIQNCSIPSSQLKKKHNAIAYHRVRESVTYRIIKLGHVSSETNFADLCTKPLSGPKLHYFMKHIYN